MRGACSARACAADTPDGADPHPGTPERTGRDAHPHSGADRHGSSRTTDTDRRSASRGTNVGTACDVAEKLAAGDAALLNSGFGGAEASYRAVLKADPGSAAAHTGLSQTYYEQMGEQKRALDEAQLAIASDPDFAPGWVALAEVQAVLGLAADAWRRPSRRSSSPILPTHRRLSPAPTSPTSVSTTR